MPIAAEDITALEAEIAALNTSITDGVRIVVLPGGQSTTYQTTASMIQARDDALARLAAMRLQYASEQGEVVRPRQRLTNLYYAGRGYYDC